MGCGRKQRQGRTFGAQILQGGRPAFQHERWGKPEYLSQLLVLLKNGRGEVKTCNSTGSSQTSQTETCSAAGLTHPCCHHRKRMHLWESKTACMKLERVRGSRMSRVQGEEKFYRVNLRLAGWVGGWMTAGSIPNGNTMEISIHLRAKRCKKWQIPSWYHPN